MKKIGLYLFMVVLLLSLMACSNQEANESINNAINDSTDNVEKDSGDASEEEEVQHNFIPLDINSLSDEKRPLVTLDFVSGERIVFKMVPELAPNTVNNFLTLALDGYYDGIIFHRIIEGFMMQGGDPQGTGGGGPGYTIKDEFFVIDDLDVHYLSHQRGVVSMAKTQMPHSAGSQFFIMHEDGQFLDGQYAAFAFVVEGMDVVDQFASVKTNEADKPLEDVTIKTVTVELNGYDLKAPEKIQP